MKTFLISVIVFFLFVSSQVFAETTGWKEEILDRVGFSKRYLGKSCDVWVFRDGRGIKIFLHHPTLPKLVIDLTKLEGRVIYGKLREGYKSQLEACEITLKTLPADVQNAHLP